MLRLGVNVDHVATIRNARGGTHPDPVAAAKLVLSAGADGITAHLREDRRHIRDDDMRRLRHEIAAPLNFEMAATAEMMSIALELRPYACCLVPERRTEVTTEGGLDVAGNIDSLTGYIARLADAGIRVSLFVDPDRRQLDAAKRVGAPVVELHTGAYAHADDKSSAHELQRLVTAARHASEIGLECHAGHGLDFGNVGPVAAIPQLVELNIGHFLVGEAVFGGLAGAVRTMRGLMDRSRPAGT
jgi:pyridoxine 5-phosphate synthase